MFLLPRRSLLRLGLVTPLLRAQQSAPEFPDRKIHMPSDREPERRLPNGKSQKDAIAKENHERALSEAQQLLRLATALKDDLEKAGDFVVPVAALKTTEEIEKLAKRIRGRLKA